MERNTIVIAEWNPRNEKSSNNSIFVGRYRGLEKESTKLYGICLEGLDPTKDCQLHGYSLHRANLRKDIIAAKSREKVRMLLIAQIDKALDHLFSEESIKEAEDYDQYIAEIFHEGSMQINED